MEEGTTMLEGGSAGKFRREKRKDERKAKKQKLHQSWLLHQNAKKKKKVEREMEPPKEAEEVKQEAKDHKKKKEDRIKSNSRKKTKFEEFIAMETNKLGFSDQLDVETEKKLAKKLKIKGGKLGGLDDGLDMLLDGIPSTLDEDVGFGETNMLEETTKKGKKKKKKKKKKKVEDAQDAESGRSPPEAAIEMTKYVAPHLRPCSGTNSEEMSQMRRSVRGLLNRLSESNIESITREVAELYQLTRRSVSFQVVCEEVLSSCSQGPRGNEQYAAIFAAFVTGMACSVGVDFGAKLMAALSISFEEEYKKEDGIALRNLTLFLSYLYIFGACSSDLVYDFLLVLTKRLTELDVSTILTILQCCGMKLRASNPSEMKQFIIAIQSRVVDLDAASPSSRSKRMEFMLETICDIKNNKKKAKEDPAHHTRIKKWLQKLRVDDIMLRNLTWGKLLDPEKKGQWWLSGESMAAAVGDENVREVATATDRQATEAQQLIQLAAAQRMNTDVRRAIFCIVISAEDYIDAFEKILRLNLSDKQDREIMRVLLECCLQEKFFNRYYVILAAKFCSHDKNHKFTLQYCLWDHYKELEGMELRRSHNLARFAAEMLTSFALPLAALKVVDFAAAGMAEGKVTHFRMLFEEVLAAADSVVWNMFTRIAGSPELESLRSGLEFFIGRHVVTGDGAALRGKFNLIRKALRNIEGVLM